MTQKKQLSTVKKENGSMLPNEAEKGTHGNMKKQDGTGIVNGVTPTPKLADASLYF